MAWANRGGHSTSSSRGGPMCSRRRTWARGGPATEYRVPNQALTPSEDAHGRHDDGLPEDEREDEQDDREGGTKAMAAGIDEPRLTETT